MSWSRFYSGLNGTLYREFMYVSGGPIAPVLDVQVSIVGVIREWGMCVH